MFLFILLFLLFPSVSQAFPVSECHNVFLEKDSEKTHVQRRRKWMLYEEAKAFIQKKGIKSQREFYKWSKSGKRPRNLPSTPAIVYAEEWEGWAEFLGTGNRANPKRDWISYEQAQVFIQAEAVKNEREFREWSKKFRPFHFPSHPERIYKEEWQGWGEFLGTDNKPGSPRRDWRAYEEAKVYIQAQAIFTVAQFREWSKSEKRPFDFPSNPNKVYAEEWEGWDEFLGNKN